MTGHIKAITKAINESRHAWKFSKIYIMSQEACPIFETLNDPSVEKVFFCPLSHGVMKKALAELKPDLFIALDRLDFLPSTKTPLGDKLTDELTNGILKEMNEYSSYSKNIVMLKPNFVIEP
uniref:Uncharacterized protein n=1 Tax=Panagrolaimus sp. JU765 TaxID=591449 RepID=A0AC34RN42_9BILA